MYFLDWMANKPASFIMILLFLKEIQKFPISLKQIDQRETFE